MANVPRILLAGCTESDVNCFRDAFSDFECWIETVALETDGLNQLPRNYTEVFMIYRICLFITIAFISGCSGPTFTNLGNGVGVPTESIDNYAKANGISRDEASKRMLEESNQRRQAESMN